jgi:1-acyl-sn-glycerol-3-phosphate acyltransferase
LSRGQTSLAVRIVRLGRLAMHFAAGLATVLFLFPRWDDRRRNVAIRRWSARLLAILAVRLHCEHRPDRFPERCLLALNHISWLDVFAVNAVEPAVFVAKSEIRAWPLAGTLVSGVGTLYLDRDSRSALRRTNRRIEEALARGRLVACFPEGTTSEGDEVQKFHAALLQPALDASAMIQPVALRYLDGAGSRTTAAGYVGDESLLDSVRKILAMPRMTAELRFLPAVPAHPGMHRRTLAQDLRSAIARSLEAP